MKAATGWWDPKFDKMLDDANNTVDPQKRFEILARAEYLCHAAANYHPAGH